MLKSTSILIFYLIAVSESADHNLFKNCSRVPFCTELRNRTPQQKYTVNKSATTVSLLGEIILHLTPNDGSKEIVLIIDTHAGGTFRIRGTESDYQRYQLKDVIDKQPSEPRDTVCFYDEEAQIVIAENIYKVVVNATPFQIEYYYENDLQMTFDTNDLNFEGNSFSFSVTFPRASQLFGIHEHADKLALRDTTKGGSDPYRLRNLDDAGYDLDSPMAMYGSVPVLIAHGVESTTGVFSHNAAEQWVDITNGDGVTKAFFMVETAELDLFLFSGPKPVNVVHQYTALTGTAHLPQLWTLGYHQSRWTYADQEDVKSVVANFNANNFSLDSIWLDIDYTDNKKYFTWNPDTFSDPLEMQKNVSATHKRMVAIIDPHIKVEPGYEVYDGALANDFFVKNSNDTIFEGDCWPGLSSYIDFLNFKARDYYGSFYSYDKFPNSTEVIAGIWNDMNEPSVFIDSLEKTLPGDAKHVDKIIHRDVHNIYGLLHTRTTHEGLLKRDNFTRRPFVLTRAHFSGTQRFSAIWTGDNTAEWGYLADSYSLCLNANLLGLVFCGSDVGGFVGNPSEELFQRWYQAGAWLPFYRAHSAAGTDRREPYLFSTDIQNVVRNAIELRYQHLPVWYTLFYQHNRTGDPIIRPLFYQYPNDSAVLEIDNQLLVGDDILVRAITEPGVQSVPVYFPGGATERWFSINTFDVFSGDGFIDIPVDINQIPVFYRSGSIIVRKDTKRLSTDEMTSDGYTLYANLNSSNQARGVVYIDDNTSFDYFTKNLYNYLQIDIENENVTLTKIDNQAVSEQFPFQIDSVITHKITKEPIGKQPGTYEKHVFQKDRVAIV